VLNVHASTADKIYVIKDRFYEELKNVFDKFSKYHKKILLDFNAKLGREDIFKPTIRNENLHEISNGNGIKVSTLPHQKSYCQKCDVSSS
jgi:hypothetical protein